MELVPASMTLRNSSIAVWPIRRRASSGSCVPGRFTRTLSFPRRLISAFAIPYWSTRFVRMVTILSKVSRL